MGWLPSTTELAEKWLNFWSGIRIAQNFPKREWYRCCCTSSVGRSQTGSAWIFLWVHLRRGTDGQGCSIFKSELLCLRMDYESISHPSISISSWVGIRTPFACKLSCVMQYVVLERGYTLGLYRNPQLRISKTDLLFLTPRSSRGGSFFRFDSTRTETILWCKEHFNFNVGPPRVIDRYRYCGSPVFQ